MDADKLPAELRGLVQPVGDEGKFSDTLLADLAALAISTETHVSHLCASLVECNRVSCERRNEAGRLSWQARQHEDAMVKIREELLRVLDGAGIKALMTDTHHVSVCSSPPAITMDASADLESAPARFVLVDRAWNGSALRAAYRDGKTLPKGVSFSPTRYAKVTPR